MNRRERRAASARGKYVSSAGADIAQLMAEANGAYQRQRFTQAEVICKQILSRASTHADCLNLLGTVHHAAGRHRLAVKLFAQAMAVNGLDAGFHYNMASSYEALGERILAVKHFKAAITFGISDRKLVEEFVMENEVILKYIDLVTTKHWSIGSEVHFSVDDIAAIGKDLFLRCALELTPLHGVALELFLTKLRSTLLRLVVDGAFDGAQVDADDIVHLFCALAQQCFINEYVFAQTDQEFKQASELRGLLLERLSTGGSISPLLLAAVAAYFPLCYIPAAKSLVSLKWPECADRLLRQQVSEPLEEANDRPSIPTLTEIADSTSAAVMQQYDENPYPRWTINPFKVVVDEVERHARARRSQDILVAGCGTGEHPISIARSYPDARILAVDVSRNSLGYARRKTREEGLQNIEYAQADILKLGSIGRTFDRIEAVGVLHHLADPEAGWRVLLSLLAPNGIMRVGLYSEIARRAVVRARALIAERGYRATIEDIRALRQTIIRNQYLDMVLKSGDFYHTSGCRDLLFNVMEHRFTIAQIASLLKALGLSFLGFELDAEIIEKFQQHYRDADALTNLDRWSAFEADNPHTFRGMYMFTVLKSEQGNLAREN